MITEFFIKWGLGIATGILGSIGVFFRKEIKNFFNFCLIIPFYLIYK